MRSWPRLFQNLRASRETELAEQFPIHVVAEWLGNSPKIALPHYTQVTEEHYRKAAQNPAHQSTELARVEQHAKSDDVKESEMVQQFAASCDTTQNNLMTPTGFEPVSRP